MVDRPIQNEYGKIEFKVSGLEIMKGSTDKAKVMYAKIQSESLQKIADNITQSFIDAGKYNIDDTYILIFVAYFLSFFFLSSSRIHRFREKRKQS